jgi:hypothetical protein
MVKRIILRVISFVLLAASGALCQDEGPSGNLLQSAGQQSIASRLRVSEGSGRPCPSCPAPFHAKKLGNGRAACMPFWLRSCVASGTARKSKREREEE